MCHHQSSTPILKGGGGGEGGGINRLKKDKRGIHFFVIWGLLKVGGLVKRGGGRENSCHEDC